MVEGSWTGTTWNLSNHSILQLLNPGNRVIIDCSASQGVSDYYARWMALGIHVITANKKAGSGQLQLYDECKMAQRARAQWYYETTGPGSGLPVITTLKDMMQSGDRVYQVRHHICSLGHAILIWFAEHLNPGARHVLRLDLVRAL